MSDELITEEVNDETFSEHGNEFQEKIMQALLVDKVWAQQMSEVFKSKYFDLKHLQYISDKYFKYYKKYKAFPTIILLVTIIKDDLSRETDRLLKDMIIDFFKKTNEHIDFNDLPFVKEKSLEFCRMQTMKAALGKSIDILKVGKYQEIFHVMKEAISLGEKRIVEYDYIDDIESRYDANIRGELIATGFPELDDKAVFNGGLSVGEVGIVIACTGVGKSHMLINLGANAVLNNKKVLHYTFELKDRMVSLRYDSFFCNTKISDLNKDVTKKILTEKKICTNKNLKIFEYPSHSVTIDTIRTDIERLSLKGFIPDLLIIDHMNKMMSTQKHDSVYSDQGRLVDELRNFGSEYKFPIWTAAQAKREAEEKEIISKEDAADSYGISRSVDVLLGLSVAQNDKKNGYGKLHIAKSRLGPDGLVFSIQLDSSTSRFKILGGAHSEKERLDEEIKNRTNLSQKLKNIKVANIIEE
jgi:replicative DNA helicase